MSGILRDDLRSGGEFPLAHNEELQGGIHFVTTIGNIDEELPEYIRDEGELVFTLDTHQFYDFEGGITSNDLKHLGGFEGGGDDLQVETPNGYLDLVVHSKKYLFPIYNKTDVAISMNIPDNSYAAVIQSCSVSFHNSHRITTSIPNVDWNFDESTNTLIVDFNGSTIAEGFIVVEVYQTHNHIV